MQRLLNTEELAQKLRLSPRTLYNLVCLKQIPFVKAGGALRFVEAEIDEWLRRKSGIKEATNASK